jgi:hypothetical protein
MGIEKIATIRKEEQQMTRYRVRAIIEVELNINDEAGDIDTMADALEEVEVKINREFSKTNQFLYCKLKKVEVQLEDN